MKAADCILGIDAGNSVVKAVAFDTPAATSAATKSRPR